MFEFLLMFNLVWGLLPPTFKICFMKRVTLSELRLGTKFKLFPTSSHSYTLLRFDGTDSYVLHSSKDTEYYPIIFPSDITVYVI